MKSQLYSIIAILIIIPIFLFITQYLTSSQTIRQEISEKIVADQLHQLEKSVEQDFSKALTITNKRALLAAINWVIENGTGLDDAKFRLNELMENESLHGNKSFLMENNTLKDWKNKILAIPTGFNLDLNYSNLTIENWYGFNLNASTNLNISVSDNLGIAKIEKNDLEKSVLISVSGLEDPIFPLNTQGFVRRTVIKYPFPFYTKKIVTGASSGNCSGNATFNESDTGLNKILITHNASGKGSGFGGVVSETSDLPSVSCYVIEASNAVNEINDTINQANYSIIYLDNLTDGVWSLPINQGLEQGYYSYFNESGPNFLQRLEANLNSSTNGLETWVNIPELEQAGIPVYDYSRIAYLYFSDYPGCYKVRGLPDWFRIDWEHAVKYDLGDLAYSVC